MVLRLARLQRQPLCELCSTSAHPVAATTPDHIIPLALGGTDTDDNIRCLCAACHERVTREQFGQRVRSRIGADGWPVE
jgi:5-methylcytosine-specific restriction protein A